MWILGGALRGTWDSLRAKKQVEDDSLNEVRLRRLRGIGRLRVAFDYPVFVIAGGNGRGKSTVLFACAAAFTRVGRSTRTYTPGVLFPGFTDGGEGGFVDEAGETGLGRLETEVARGEIAAFSVGLTDQIGGWRQAGAR